MNIYDKDSKIIKIFVDKDLDVNRLTEYEAEYSYNYIKGKMLKKCTSSL